MKKALLFVLLALAVIALSLGAQTFPPVSSGPSGSGTAGRVAVWSGASALTSNARFLFDGSVAGTGFQFTTAAAGSRATISVLSSGTDEGLNITAKGSGVIGMTGLGVELSGTSGNGILNNITGDFYLVNYGGGRDTIVQIQGNNILNMSDRPAETFVFSDSTPTTGVTTGVIRAGAGQSTGTLLQFRNAADAVMSDISASGGARFPTYSTMTNCADSAGDAACGAAAAGHFVIDAADTTTVVSTTVVTANSEITLTEDSSLGTLLSVTCNTTPGTALTVSARTAGVSFTVLGNAPTTNPRCLGYTIRN